MIIPSLFKTLPALNISICQSSGALWKTGPWELNLMFIMSTRYCFNIVALTPHHVGSELPCMTERVPDVMVSSVYFVFSFSSSYVSLDLLRWTGRGTRRHGSHGEEKRADKQNSIHTVNKLVILH